MRILIIHQWFATPTQPGGTRHYELASHLVQRGHECTIVTCNVSYVTGEKIVDGRGLVIEQQAGGLRILRAYSYAAIHRSFVGRLVSFLSFMATSVWAALRLKDVDLVMGTSPPLFQGVSAWLVALLRRRPFLLEIRDLWPEFAIDIGVLKNPVLIKLSRWLERFLYGRATHFLVNSPAYRDYLVAKGIAPEKISLIANGVDPDMFPPQSDGRAVRQQLRLDGKFVVTYAGALGMANDIDTILRAAAQLRDDLSIHFLFVGGGKEQANLEMLAQSLKLENVTFAGGRNKNEMPEILAASDACLATLKDIPMFRTTYPNKVFDYMAAARPTILAIDGVIREVVDRAEGGIFVPPGDAGALAEAVRSLRADPDRGRSMGLAARRYVEEHFNRHTQAEEFTDLLEQLSHRNGHISGEPPVPEVRQTCA
jgi:glycosyltransferase involved in cell wall biosynthesis